MAETSIDAKRRQPQSRAFGVMGVAAARRASMLWVAIAAIATRARLLSRPMAKRPNLKLNRPGAERKLAAVEIETARPRRRLSRVLPNPRVIERKRSARSRHL
jgi:hypothetical protein